MRAIPLLLLLVGCAGSLDPVSVATGGAPALGSGDSGGSATRSALRAPAESLLCIGSGLSDVQVLGWLAGHGYLEGEPWDKLFLEPPMTGPRAGVDTTRYVDFFRGMCERTVSSWDSTACRFVPFAEWPPDSQDAFAGREWRCGVFNLCDPGECLCSGTRWSFASEVPR